MIWVFDLDDTLYDEKSFVRSGLQAVADFLSERTGQHTSILYEELLEEIEKSGRGKVFDVILRRYGLFSERMLRQCISAYRLHKPSIHLFHGVKEMLAGLQKYPCYLVTDGNKIVQANKVKALGIEKYFRKVYITHRYGVHNAKPSTYCFEKIRAREKADFSQMVYIGDNPQKDFVGVKKLGMRTIRVLTGNFGDAKPAPEREAEQIVKKVTDINFDLVFS